MSKLALAGALGLLLFFTYLTAIRQAYNFAYALSLLFVVAWLWPRLAIRGVRLSRRVDPGTPTVGEVYEEVFEVQRKGWVPAPWVEVRDLSQLPDRLSARDRRRARLRHRRQLRPHPLAALGQAPAPDVEDVRAADDHRPVDPPRPRPRRPFRRRRGVDGRVRGEPGGLHGVPGAQPRPPGRPHRQ